VGNKRQANDWLAQILGMPARKCNNAIIKATISNLKFRAKDFLPAQPLQFLIAEQTSLATTAFLAHYQLQRA
jgi:hypothetical protein